MVDPWRSLAGEVHILARSGGGNRKRATSVLWEPPGGSSGSDAELGRLPYRGDVRAEPGRGLPVPQLAELGKNTLAPGVSRPLQPHQHRLFHVNDMLASICVCDLPGVTC